MRKEFRKGGRACRSLAVLLAAAMVLSGPSLDAGLVLAAVQSKTPDTGAIRAAIVSPQIPQTPSNVLPLLSASGIGNALLALPEGKPQEAGGGAAATAVPVPSADMIAVGQAVDHVQDDLASGAGSESAAQGGADIERAVLGGLPARGASAVAVQDQGDVFATAQFQPPTQPPRASRSLRKALAVAVKTIKTIGVEDNELASALSFAHEYAQARPGSPEVRKVLYDLRLRERLVEIGPNGRFQTIAFSSFMEKQLPVQSLKERETVLLLRAFEAIFIAAAAGIWYAEGYFNWSAIFHRDSLELLHIFKWIISAVPMLSPFVTRSKRDERQRKIDSDMFGMPDADRNGIEIYEAGFRFYNDPSEVLRRLRGEYRILHEQAFTRESARRELGRSAEHDGPPLLRDEPFNAGIAKLLRNNETKGTARDILKQFILVQAYMARLSGDAARIDWLSRRGQLLHDPFYNSWDIDKGSITTKIRAMLEFGGLRDNDDFMARVDASLEAHHTATARRLGSAGKQIP